MEISKKNCLNLEGNKPNTGENFAKKREIAKKIQELLKENEKLKNTFSTIDKDDIWRGGMGLMIVLFYLEMASENGVIDFLINTNDKLLTYLAISSVGVPGAITLNRLINLKNIVRNNIDIILQKQKFQKINHTTK